MKRILLSALLLLLPLLLPAQSRGSYFFDNSLLRHKLNPAFAPQVRYISVPVIGSGTYDAASNIGLGNFVFPRANTTYSFLSDQVDAETFLGKLPRKDPYVNARFETDLLGGGMPLGEHGYATVSLSVVGSANVVIPGSLLRFAKLGRTDGTERWDIKGLQGGFYRYASLAAGYSHDLGSLVEGLRVGGRLHLLVGLSAARADIDQISVRMQEDLFAAEMRGAGDLSGYGYLLQDSFRWGGLRPRKLVLGDIGLRGIGTAIDLGFEYRLPLDGFLESVNFSASVNDLGFIWYNRGIKDISFDGSFAFSGFENLNRGNLSGLVNAVIDDLKEQACPDVSDGSPFVHALSPSIYAGAEVPFYVLAFRMHAGLLYYHSVGRSNLMAAYGISPFEWLNLGLNWTFLGPAGRFGFYAEFIPRKYVGIFFGMERASFKRNSQHIPIGNATDSFAFGVNVLFGK